MMLHPPERVEQGNRGKSLPQRGLHLGSLLQPRCPQEEAHQTAADCSSNPDSEHGCRDLRTYTALHVQTESGPSLETSVSHTPSCIVAMKYGAGKAFSSCLLTMLKYMLAPAVHDSRIMLPDLLTDVEMA